MRVKQVEDKTHLTKGKELCNRTACQTSRDVFMHNKTMDAYYCVRCARLINDGARGHDFYPLCVEDLKKRKYEETDKSKTWSKWRETNKFRGE